LLIKNSKVHISKCYFKTNHRAPAYSRALCHIRKFVQRSESSCKKD